MAEIKKISTELQLLNKFLDTSGDAGTSGQLLSSTASGIDWVDPLTLSGLVDGSGTTNYVAKWTDGDTIGDSIIYDDGTKVGIGTTTPSQILDVAGNAALSTGGYIYGDTTNPYIRLNDAGGAVLGYGTSQLVNGGSLQFQSAAGVLFRINSSSGGYVIGDFGIGTTSPSEKLDVDGTIVVSGGGGAWGTSNGGVQLNFNENTSQGHLTTYYDATSLLLGAGVSQKTGITINGQSSASGNNILFRLGDSERVRIDGDGNVGIGTTTPSTKLEVLGDTTIRNANGSNPADAGSLYFKEAGDTWGTDFYGFRINNQGVTNSLKFQSANTTTIVDIISLSRDSGNVGIGTNSPGEKLEVNGVSKINGIKVGEINGAERHISSHSNSGALVLNGGTKDDTSENKIRIKGSSFSSGGIEFTAGDSLRMSILSDGNVGIGSASPSEKLEVAGKIVSKYGSGSNDAVIEHKDSSNNVIFSFRRSDGAGGNGNDLVIRAYEDIHLAPNNSDTSRFVVKTNGNVGIGTTSPGEKLEVDGNVQATSFIKDGGTSSQFLKADGSVDTNTYISTFNETDTLDSVTGRGATTTNNITVGTIGSGAITSTGKIAGTELEGTSLDISGAGSVTGALTLGTTSGSNMHMIRTSANYINATNATGYLVFRTGGYNTALTLSASQEATFAGDVILPNDGKLKFKNSIDTPVGVMTFNASNELVIYNGNSPNGDILFKDAGPTGTTNLTIDGSSGNATFGGSIDSGAITSTGKISGTELEGTSLDVNGDADISGNVDITGNATASTFVKDGGTSTQFLKADGSIDTSTYLTSASISGFIDGSGSAGTIPKFTDSDTVEDSIITEDSGKIGIDIASPKAALHVNGAVIVGNDTTAASSDLAGALRYWDETDGGNVTSYVDMCMKDGCGYSWVNIVTNRTLCL